MSEVRRTVLLAKPGEARDRLRAALENEGVEVVLVANPLDADVDQVVAVHPRNLVVALDEETEDALERFDALLSDRRYSVLFEEVALIDSRGGWDVARWSRHLGAKLLGHGDVLPTGHELDDEIVAVEANATAMASKADPGVIAESASTLDDGDADQDGYDLGLEELEDDASTLGGALDIGANHEMASSGDGLGLGDEDDAIPPVRDAPGDADWLRFQDYDAVSELPAANAPHSAENDYRSALAPVDRNDLPHEQAYEQLEQEMAGFGGDKPVDRWQDFERPKLDVEIVEAQAEDQAGPVEAAQAQPPELPKAPDWSLLDEPEALAPPRFDATGEGPASAPGLPKSDTVYANQAPVGHDRLSVSASRPLDNDLATNAEGVVLLVGGIGGPDPVRQILQQIGKGLSVPVLVQQWLDGGQYDRLVRQMARASTTSVELATAGAKLIPGKVYIVPVAMTAKRDAEGSLCFEHAPGKGFADIVSSIPAASSGVVLLSGASQDYLEPVKRFKQAGGRVFAQSAVGCYDHTVPGLLIQGGIEGFLPTEIATQLSARWHY